MHRNLWVANRDPAYDSKCRAPGCTQDESMMHLAVCPIITREYWDKVRNLLVQLGLPAPNTHRFLLLGVIDNNHVVGRAAAGMMFIAWRCAYAEIVGSRLDNRAQNWKGAYRRFVGMTISRLKAYGLKWYRWYSRIRRIQVEERKTIPIKYQKRILIESDKFGAYKIHPLLLREYEKIK